jgi:hypothetical protein
VTPSIIFNAVNHISAAVDDLQQSMKPLMTLTEDGFLKTDEGIQSFASTGLAVSPMMTDTMIDTFEAMQSSCNQLLLTMQTTASQTDLVELFNEFRVSMEGSLEEYQFECRQCVTDDSVLSSLQQQDTNMTTGFTSILAALQDSTSRNGLEHSELSEWIAVLSKQVAGLGEGVSSIIMLTEAKGCRICSMTC